MGLAEELKGIAVGLGLVLAGEVQVDIGDLVAAEAKEGLKGDVEAVLYIGRAADGTNCVLHVRVAARALGLGGLEVGVLAARAAVVGRQGVDLRDARHEGHQGGADAAAGADQIAVLQGVLHQLLGGHIDHVVLAVDDVPQLHVDAVGDDLGRLLAVKLFRFPPDQPLQLPVGVLQLGGEETLGQRVHALAPVGHQIGVAHHHVVAVLPAQIAELLQHLGGGLEVEGQG